MYDFPWYDWIMFFFIYSFFGWIIESTYVSFLKKRFVNRGFLRLPLLPLYGTGAVMMLWVSIPFRDHVFLVWLSGMIGATALEYVTGYVMELLFKMKYWDYSDQRFQLNGYICLSSSIAWGFLTIFLTEVIHRPISSFVAALDPRIKFPCLIVVGILFVADTAASVREAIDLGRALEAMTKLRAELDELRVQAASYGHELKNEARQKAESAASRIRALTEKQLKLSHMNFYRRSLLRGNPTASSTRFAAALKELRDSLDKHHRQ